MSNQIYVHVDEAGPPEGDEIGEPSKDGKCPKCGSGIDGGFGLCYGGYGPYEFCMNEECSWYWKKRMPHDAE